MKFSESWLRTLVNPPVSSDELLEQLTMAGLEVEGVADCDPGLAGVVVARVEKLEQHPSSEKLKVCQVDAGDGKLYTVVCGADNVQVGYCYPFAMIGAKLPGGITISDTTLRGILSEGMLCSEKELGLSEQSDGIFELTEDTPPGIDIRKHLGLEDKVIEISLTPNRGDCLSLIGIAREVAVLNNLEFNVSAAAEVSPVIDATRAIHLAAVEACPRYCGRIIINVDVSRSAPAWVIERLRRSDIRSINAVVDLTNYVMLETGQPMHAFDNDQLQGDISIRFARDKEKLLLLDEQTCELSANTLLICDGSGPIAMAGIMGGLDTAVTDSTRNLFLESAFFSPLAIMGRARQYGLHTDASHRYERGVDPQLCRNTVERLTALILEFCGGQPGPVVEAINKSNLPATTTLLLRRQRVNRILGMSVPDQRINEILKQLGFQVKTVDSGWDVAVPPHRFDIEIEADLIEEVARIYGYDNIAGSLPKTGMYIRETGSNKRLLQQMSQSLVERGYREAITYSFVEPGLQSSLLGASNAVRLLNPISSDMSVMRQSLWPGLIQTLLYNLKRQQQRIRLFEIGKVFSPGSTAAEVAVIAGITYGNIYYKQWGISNISSDFYDLKSDLEAILVSCLDRADIQYRAAAHKALHPGQSAEIWHNDQKIGLIGALHPLLADKQGLQQTVFMFEINLELLSPKTPVKFTKISKYPSIKRDISIVIDHEIPVQEILNCIRYQATAIFHNLELFDVYHGEGIDSGKKSLALGLTFQRSSSTLTDEEADIAVGNILNSLYKQFGATLRE